MNPRTCTERVDPTEGVHLTSGNQILDFEDPKARAHKALKKFVLTVASTRGLGDEIVNMYTAMDREIHPFLKECAHDAGLKPEVFRAYATTRLQGQSRPFNDVQLLCIGDKMHHWLDPDFKPQNLLELEQDLEREFARLRSPELVGA